MGIAAASIPLAVIDATAVKSDLVPAAFLATAALGFLVLRGKYRFAFYVVLTAGAVQAKVIVAPVAVVMTVVLVLLFDGGRGRSSSAAFSPIPPGHWGHHHRFHAHARADGPPRGEQRRTIYRSGSPALASGAAAGRIPNLFDILLLPVNPFITGIIGQHEPYGGRTGLAMSVGLPVVGIALIGLGT